MNKTFLFLGALCMLLAFLLLSCGGKRKVLQAETPEVGTEVVSQVETLEASTEVAPQAATTENDFELENGIITKYIGTETTVAIPSQIQGKLVTIIGEKAFEKKGIISVTIPNSMTTIGNFAFAGNKLTSVTIPSSVTAIKPCAFSGNKLTNVAIPSSVTELSGFDRNQLKSINIPNSVTSIEASAFSSNQLESINIPDGVTSIGDYAFERNQLTSVTIPSNVTTIGNSAFTDNQLDSVVIPNSVTAIGEGAFARNQLKSVTIPGSVITIESYAFIDNNLTHITIESGVTTIGGGAFLRNNLASITIGEKVELETENIESDDRDFNIYPFSEDYNDASFEKVYYSNGQKAGTYTLNKGKWSLQGGGKKVKTATPNELMKKWMKKNLDVETENSQCYDDNPANCQKYGRLYTWEEAKKACASLGNGWRLPTNADWNALVNAAGGANKAGKILNSASLGSHDWVPWWSGTERSAKDAWLRRIVASRVDSFGSDKGEKFYVRCVKE